MTTATKTTTARKTSPKAAGKVTPAPKKATAAKKSPAKSTTAKPAAARSTGPRVIETPAKPTAAAKTTAKVFPSGSLERYNAAKAEHAAAKAYVAGGSKGKAPSTPNLDAMNADAANGKSPKPRSAKSSTPRAPKVPSVFTRDGKPIAAGRGLSYIAWHATKGVASEDSPRIGVKDLVEVLAGLGVDQPELTVWEVVLPNGVKIGRRDPKRGEVAA